MASPETTLIIYNPDIRLSPEEVEEGVKILEKLQQGSFWEGPWRKRDWATLLGTVGAILVPSIALKAVLVTAVIKGVRSRLSTERFVTELGFEKVEGGMKIGEQEGRVQVVWNDKLYITSGNIDRNDPISFFEEIQNIQVLQEPQLAAPVQTMLIYDSEKNVVYEQEIMEEPLEAVKAAFEEASFHCVGYSVEYGVLLEEFLNENWGQLDLQKELTRLQNELLELGFVIEDFELRHFGVFECDEGFKLLRLGVEKLCSSNDVLAFEDEVMGDLAIGTTKEQKSNFNMFLMRKGLEECRYISKFEECRGKLLEDFKSARFDGLSFSSRDNRALSKQLSWFMQPLNQIEFESVVGSFGMRSVRGVGEQVYFYNYPAEFIKQIESPSGSNDHLEEYVKFMIENPEVSGCVRYVMMARRPPMTNCSVDCYPVCLNRGIDFDVLVEGCKLYGFSCVGFSAGNYQSLENLIVTDANRGYITAQLEGFIRRLKESDPFVCTQDTVILWEGEQTRGEFRLFGAKPQNELFFKGNAPEYLSESIKIKEKRVEVSLYHRMKKLLDGKKYSELSQFTQQCLGYSVFFETCISEKSEKVSAFLQSTRDRIRRTLISEDDTELYNLIEPQRSHFLQQIFAHISETYDLKK